MRHWDILFNQVDSPGDYIGESDEIIQGAKRKYDEDPSHINAENYANQLMRYGRSKEAADVEIGHHVKHFKEGYHNYYALKAKKDRAVKGADKRNVTWFSQPHITKQYAAANDAEAAVKQSANNLHDLAHKYNLKHLGRHFPAREHKSPRSHMKMLSVAHGSILPLEAPNSSEFDPNTHSAYFISMKQRRPTKKQTLNANRYEQAIKYAYPKAEIMRDSHVSAPEGLDASHAHSLHAYNSNP